MISSGHKQMSATGQRTEISGERKLSSRQETPTKLAGAELEQEKIATFK
jgi:hypothetical protein